jgi:transcriptional regulator with XRE-family HTH domain
MLEKVFGKTLKQIRTERRLSQEKLAELCELDRTYISLLERGLRQPTLSTLFKLSEALEIEPDDFIKRIKHE